MSFRTSDETTGHDRSAEDAIMPRIASLLYSAIACLVFFGIRMRLKRTRLGDEALVILLRASFAGARQ